MFLSHQLHLHHMFHLYSDMSWTVYFHSKQRADFASLCFHSSKLLSFRCFLQSMFWFVIFYIVTLYYSVLFPYLIPFPYQCNCPWFSLFPSLFPVLSLPLLRPHVLSLMTCCFPSTSSLGHSCFYSYSPFSAPASSDPLPPLCHPSFFLQPSPLPLLSFPHFII